MIDLFGTLNQLCIKSRSDLLRWLDNGPKEAPLKTITDENACEVLGKTYDHKEGRIFETKIRLENFIVNLPSLNLRDANEVSLVNCIFLNKVGLGVSETMDILIDTCIFLDDLVIGRAGNKEDITIYKTSVMRLFFSGLDAEQLYLSDSRIQYLEFDDSHVKCFRAVGNIIEGIYVHDSIFERVVFPSSQINRAFFKGSSRVRYFSKKRSLRFRDSLLSKGNIDLFSSVNTDFEDYMASRSFVAEQETIDFVTKFTDAKSNRNTYADLVLNKAIYSQGTILWKLFMYCFGGFVKPLRILLIAILAYIAFGALYATSFCQFAYGGKQMQVLGIGEAFYFSGITFTTIGYGDIVPIGFSRFLAVSEGAIGIFLISAFVVALVRKYVES